MARSGMPPSSGAASWPVGDGARVREGVMVGVASARMRLPNRERLGRSVDEGEGGRDDSTGTYDSRPALSDMRCCDDRLRARGCEDCRDSGDRGLIS